MADPRRGWVRGLAYTIGLAVFLAHVMTLAIPTTRPDWLSLEMRDLAGHFAMLFTFALVYRLSFTRAARLPSLATACVCAGWGAACECSQLLISTREFNLFELSANIIAPLFVAALFYIIRGR
ncbi:hypothetical protein JW859_02995 [bacterium]|nr:hypothetical protein [bacterium]